MKRTRVITVRKDFLPSIIIIFIIIICLPFYYIVVVVVIVVPATYKCFALSRLLPPPVKTNTPTYS